MEEESNIKVGDTPTLIIKNLIENATIYSKQEGVNHSGSMKDRAAKNVLEKALREGRLKPGGIVIESSSGNMGIALATYCKALNLQFYCVIDPNITKTNKKILEEMDVNLIQVTKVDKNNGYLLSRIDEVHKFLAEHKDAFWINQYDNLDVIEGYYSLANELYNKVKPIDYLFMAVSSGGSIAGVSKRLKELSPNVKVICVDVKGSVIFGQPPEKRYIPGAGSSIRPNNIREACIDDLVIIEEKDVVKMCLEYKEQGIVLGGSSGLVLAGIKKYFIMHPKSGNINIATVFADQGFRYMETIYDENWRKKIFNK